ncbi:MAG: glycosyltransferase family 4 protein [Oscillospiraceae bacterium]|nr:glycosyltransferase family 4 protein [Oscillospiraceae bacterium]
MKILILRTFASVLNPNNYNSQEIGLARAFIRAGHRCDIVYYNASDATRTQTVETPGSDTPVTIYWMKGYSVYKNAIFPGLKKVIEQYDVLQVAEYDQLTSWWLYCHYGTKKPVFLYHGPYGSDFTKGYNLKCKVFDTFFNRPGKNRAVTAFAKSRMAAEFLHAKGFEKVIPVGVGLDTDTLKAPYEPNARPAAAAREGFELLYIGVLEERRNIRFLFEVLAKAAEQVPGLRLTLVGKGEEAYRDACFAYAKELGVWDRIEYIERVPQSEVHALYKRANLFVLPTRYEIFGMVILEAMYFGQPVLTSLNGGSDLLVEHGRTGYVCEGFDAEEYAAHIAALAADPALQVSMGEAAHERIERHFVWDEIAPKMLAEYEKVL